MNDLFVCLDLLILIIKRHINDINFSCEVVGKFWLRFSLDNIIALWKRVLNFSQNSVWFIFIFILSFSFYLKYTWSLERVTTRLTRLTRNINNPGELLWWDEQVCKVLLTAKYLPFTRAVSNNLIKGKFNKKSTSLICLLEFQGPTGPLKILAHAETFSLLTRMFASLTSNWYTIRLHTY